MKNNRCSKCLLEKPEDRIDNYCKSCRFEYSNTWKFNKKQKSSKSVDTNNDNDLYKTCSKCQLVKYVDKFVLSTGGSLSFKCIECLGPILTEIWRNKPPAFIGPMQTGTRWCNHCGITKIADMFTKGNNSTGLSITCRACKNIWAKERRMADRDYYLTKETKRRHDFPAKTLLIQIKYKCRKFNIPINITAEDIEAVWPKDNKCPIFGTIFEIGKGVVGPKSATVDRFDPNLGYVVGNIHVICHKANGIKNNGSALDVMKVAKWMKRISDSLKGSKS